MVQATSSGLGRRGSLLVAALLAALALGAPAADAAKGKGKKKAKPKNVDVTRAINAPVPDRGPLATDPVGRLTDTISLGKQFKGLQVRDVNVTVQTTGSAAGSASNLIALLTAPDQSTTTLFFSLSGQSIGPLTLDDESVAALFNGPPPCLIPDWLCQPYAGKTRPGIAQIGSPLAAMDGGAVRGSWTLTLYDTTNTQTSVLNSWRLQVVTSRPYKTK